MKKYLPYLLLLVIMSLGIVAISFSRFELRTKVSLAEEEARPAKLELTMITTPDCIDCFDLQHVVSAIVAEGPEIMSEKIVASDSEEGQRLIAENNVLIIPTVIIEGEINKTNIRPFLEKYATLTESSAVWTNLSPVYLDVRTGEPVGRIKITILADDNCPDCYDPESLIELLKTDFGLIVDSVETIDIASSTGKQLVEENNVLISPTIILSADTSTYPALASIWRNVGTISDNGKFVFSTPEALGKVTYRNLTSGELISAELKN